MNLSHVVPLQFTLFTKSCLHLLVVSAQIDLIQVGRLTVKSAEAGQLGKGWEGCPVMCSGVFILAISFNTGYLLSPAVVVHFVAVWVYRSGAINPAIFWCMPQILTLNQLGKAKSIAGT